MSDRLGAGCKGFVDSKGAAAAFHHPMGLKIGPDGSLCVADAGNSRIRRIDRLGNVTTIAGVSTSGHQVGYRNMHEPWPSRPKHSHAIDQLLAPLQDGPVTTAQFNFPCDVACADDGTLYIADRNNHRIKLFCPLKQTVETIAGSGEMEVSDGRGEMAAFCYPMGLLLDEVNRRLYVVEKTAVRIVTVESSRERRGNRRLPFVVIRALARTVPQPRARMVEADASSSTERKTTRALHFLIAGLIPSRPFIRTLQYL